jgi:3-oxoacyl-[acyl-carrier-protein] synthase III
MKVLAVASAIPQAGASNAAVEDRLGLERGWIERRTGILQRPTVAATESTSDLAVRAGERALQQASIEPEDIGLLLLATSTPDHLLPPTAPLVAYRLRLRRAGAADLAGACAGFLYTLVLAAAYGASVRKPVLVIGANVLSRRVNPQDQATAALFSDGAGAAVLIPAEPTQFLGSYLDADGAFYDALGISAGGSREPMTAGALQEKRHLMSIRRGPTLFRQAVQTMATAGKEALKSAGIDVSAVDWWIPHQANVRMTRDAGALLGIGPQRTISVVEQFGNSSAATIPIALAYAVESNRIQRGQTLLLTAAGAGMLGAGVVLRW